MTQKVFYMQAYTSAGDKGLEINELLDEVGFEVLDTPTGFTPLASGLPLRVIKVTVEFADETQGSVA